MPNRATYEIPGLGTGTWRSTQNIPVAIDYPLIEDVIGDEAARFIYDGWNEAKFGEMVDFGGGVYGINVEMVQALNAIDLSRASGMAVEIAQQIIDVCRDVFNKQPYS